jgi:hypothetical protein
MQRIFAFTLFPKRGRNLLKLLKIIKHDTVDDTPFATKGSSLAVLCPGLMKK